MHAVSRGSCRRLREMRIGCYGSNKQELVPKNGTEEKTPLLEALSSTRYQIQ